ncbi:S-adenosyl-L-methionine-dependent methyltransferase [Chaetomium sp. MPI-SDFR-AT-0129]|nr:S-adenosyl-L-methionine-dependent methyltransferase [Chaetomium sp. MPI-SDFR-AT-0129]
MSIQAPPHVKTLLARLHAASAAQESSLSQSLFYLKRNLLHFLFGTTWSAASDDHMRDKFVALEPEKCELVYLLARAAGATTVVEAGTSFGVSTVYLALAVGQNAALRKARGEGEVKGKVIGTEKEPSKAVRAREHWKEAGREVEEAIELREGDLLETLAREDMPEVVDLLLLDIWTPMALPTLKLVQPRLRPGALVIADNTTMARGLYGEYLAYLRDPANGFKTTEAPYPGGLQVSVYLRESS